ALKWHVHEDLDMYVAFARSHGLAATSAIDVGIEPVEGAEKFTEGGWMTLVVTSLLVALCWAIRHHYRTVAAKMDILSKTLEDIPTGNEGDTTPKDLDPSKPTAVLLVNRYGGLGLHSLYALKWHVHEDLDMYVAFARSHGLAATSAIDVGIEPVEGAEKICVELAQRFPKATFFTGKLIFEREKWYQRILHNETAYAIQRRLQWRGLATVVLPIRVRE
ncbi:MAG: hypothetical protein ABSC38_00725, partial [Verrucomicrobiia bacterium]